MKTFSTFGWLALLALAGCAQPSHWDKPGGTEAALKGDTDSCYQQARVSPSTRPAPPPSAYGSTVAFSAEETRLRHERDMYDQCMAGRGYSVKR